MYVSNGNIAEARITMKRSLFPGNRYLPKMKPARSEVPMTIRVAPIETMRLLKK